MKMKKSEKQSISSWKFQLVYSSNDDDELMMMMMMTMI